MSDALVLGIDSSTQSTKLEARNLETGEVIASGSAPHPPTTPPRSEQDPEAWWDALVAACGQLGPARSRVVAVSVAAQQHGLVLLDENGQAVRPAKLWNDTTSAEQASALVERLGAEQWAQKTGSTPVAAFTVTKLAWVAENEPELLERVDKVMLPHDYLTWRLTGRHVTDRGDASGTGWFDPSTNAYRPELLDAAGVAGASWVDRLPSVLGAQTPAGEMTESGAYGLGLTPGTVVGPGSGDNMAAALGLGLAPSDVVISLGTSGVAYAVSHTPTHDPTGAVAGFADAAGAFLPLVCTLNATKVTDTVATLLGTDAAGLAALAADAAESEELVVVPWFDGERTPNRPDAAGSILGLRTATTPAQIAVAAHDGVLCGLLGGVDALSASGVDVSGVVHLIGGGARSAAYRQRCADLWQQPITIPDSDETVATGAAVQAAAIVRPRSLADVQHSWGLGAGQVVEPSTGVDAAAIRDRYATAVASL